MTWDPDEVEIDLSGFDVTGGRGNQESLTEIYSDVTLWKARMLLESPGRVEQAPNRSYLWAVMGSEIYTVRDSEVEGVTIPWLTCSCPNGDARGGRPNCYHTAAVAARIMGDDLSWVPAEQPARHR